MQSLWQQWGESVKTARRKKNLTQAELGTLTGIDQSALSGIERGRWSPSDAVRIALADALGVKVHKLFPYPDQHKEKG